MISPRHTTDCDAACNHCETCGRWLEVGDVCASCAVKAAPVIPLRKQRQGKRCAVCTEHMDRELVKAEPQHLTHPCCEYEGKR